MDSHAQPSVVIVGGGIAGLSVAKCLSDNGLSCTLIERENQLGGHVRSWACMATDRCLRCFCCTVEDLIDVVESSERVSVLTGCELESLERPGTNSFRVQVRNATNGDRQPVEAAAVVIAAGFTPYDPSEKVFWGYGVHRGVVTLQELDTLVRRDDLAGFVGESDEPLKMAFFQCVGSRDRSIGADYCSQYCCKAALRMALRLRKDKPDWEITIFYIDLQVAGKFAGSLLSLAEEKQIRLIQGVPGEIVPREDGTLEILREHKGVNVREIYDKIVLSVGQHPLPDVSRLSSLAGLETDRFGFLTAAGTQDPCRTRVDRVYVAGTVGGPKDIEQTVEHAGRTAAAVLADLNGSERTQQ
ncbi:MAG: FAD-dependent oxidoreductase [Desulfomonilaceae bacterium]|nr:FAD-dependent oxidoreductase [Desulfomonilaceae bacterium]